MKELRDAGHDPVVDPTGWSDYACATCGMRFTHEFTQRTMFIPRCTAATLDNQPA